MFDKLNANGGHANIVAILRHGWLTNAMDRYYFDMELCILNLANYITEDFKSRLGMSNFLHSRSLNEGHGSLSMWGIMNQISNGLEFIHSHGELHRDLKPSNGSYNGCSILTYASSSSVLGSSGLENLRLRLDCTRHIKSCLFHTNRQRNRRFSSSRASQIICQS